MEPRAVPGLPAIDQDWCSCLLFPPGRVSGTPSRGELTASCSSSAPELSAHGSSPSAIAAAVLSPLTRARPALPGLLHPTRQENHRNPGRPYRSIPAPERLPLLALCVGAAFLGQVFLCIPTAGHRGHVRPTGSPHW